MTTDFVITARDDRDQDRQSPKHVYCKYKDDDITVNFRLRGGWHHCGVMELSCVGYHLWHETKVDEAHAKVRAALQRLFSGEVEGFLKITELMYGADAPSLLVYWATPNQEGVMKALGFKKCDTNVINRNSNNPICLYTLEV